MYKKVDTGLDFISREKDILTFWKENRIFEKTAEDTDGKPIFNAAGKTMKGPDFTPPNLWPYIG